MLKNTVFLKRRMLKQIATATAEGVRRNNEKMRQKSI
jgi:hypothetical protein